MLSFSTNVSGFKISIKFENEADIQNLIPKEAILQTTKKTPLQHIAKASFGFGDVNAVVIFSKFEP